jgi:hypothetical protein
MKAQVFHWFATLPEKHDDLANEKDFAFTFCYLFTNQQLGFISSEEAWNVLAYLTRHWSEVEKMIEIPDEIVW